MVNQAFPVKPLIDYNLVKEQVAKDIIASQDAAKEGA